MNTVVNRLRKRAGRLYRLASRRAGAWRKLAMAIAIERGWAQSDPNRWANPSNLSPLWDERTQEIARLIPEGASVLEFGAGKMTLKGLLPEGSSYTPTDLVDRGEGTIVCDLNGAQLPSFPRHDAAVLGGVLEYVVDVPRLAETLAACCTTIILTYCIAEDDSASEILRRRKKGWSNDYLEGDILEIFQGLGLICDHQQRWRDLVIFSFRNPTGNPLVRSGEPTTRDAYPTARRSLAARVVQKVVNSAIRKSGIMLRLYERHSFSRQRDAIDAGAARRDLKLHLGCGSERLPGWIHVDLYAHGDNVVARLPEGLKRFPSHSTKFIYASHILEHIGYPEEASTFAQECYRILTPGGVLRVVVPGIQRIIEAYARDDEAFFDIQRSLHPSWCTTKLEALMYALQQDGEHKYGYDFETVSKLFTGFGYSQVVESDYNASEFEELRMDYRGIQDNHGNYLSLFVDVIK